MSVQKGDSSIRDPESRRRPRIEPSGLTTERFRVDAVLGKGGMATVFAAEDMNLHRPVAIKRLHASLDGDEEVVARFLREARIMARLSSEHTVRVHELGQDTNGLPYIVMERVWGRGLDEIVAERGPLPLSEAIEYVRQACAALEEAHACGIVHRDIKPSNILVEENPGRGARVKVIDFGVAKARPPSEDHTGLTAISTILGTPEYMSPEQLYSSREVDHRADVWGLGATLYFMLVGEAPFLASNLLQLGEQILHSPSPSLRTARPELPASVDAVIQRCLHRDPAGRYRSVAEVAGALTAALDLRLPSLNDDHEPEMTAIIESSRRVPPPEPSEPLETTQLMVAPPVIAPPLPEETPTASASHRWKLVVALALAFAFVLCAVAARLVLHIR